MGSAPFAVAKGRAGSFMTQNRGSEPFAQRSNGNASRDLTKINEFMVSHCRYRTRRRGHRRHRVQPLSRLDTAGRVP
jgi:hypothetical protein